MWDHNRGVLHQASHTTHGFLDNGLNVGPRPPQNYGRPNKRQPSPEIGRPSEFRHEYDMDENGALFFLGSAGKRKMWQNPHGIS